jgi:hypothetical protein
MTTQARNPVPTRYLSRKDVAERLNVKPATLSRYNLPEPDATIGDVRGWLPHTIDVWDAARPGRGKWAKKNGVDNPDQ